MNLPKGTIFSAGNLTKTWKVLERGVFKETDLNKLLRSWSPQTPKHQPYLLSVDFLRSYLAQARSPCEAVKQFAVRLSGKSGKGNLLDFPENMTSLIIDFMLDASALGAPELEATVEVLLAKPTWYWKHLGETDEQRAAAHQERVTAKALWALEIRRGLQRALNDVRCYRPDPVADILVLSSKRRRSPDQSGCMRCAIHCQPPPEADD